MVSLIVIILFVGNPFGPFESFSNRIWPYLYFYGLDIATTPFTSDMFLTYDSKTSKNYYSRKMRIKIFQSNNINTDVPVDSLTFKNFKLPFLLFVERNFEKGNSRFHKYALCMSLRKIFPLIIGFEATINSSGKHFNSLGFNKKYDC